MKKSISNILNGVAGGALFITLWGCAAENPFETEGEGIVRLNTKINSIITRADEASSDPLRENCVVYISNEKGLIYKEKGLDNVKESFTLKAGKYVAEAWTGDSVSASFDKKFYRGYEPFTVTKGSTSNVVVNCRIANVVASVNTATIDPNLMKDDYQITIKNSRGELTFNKDNASFEKAYFMMPNGDTSLEYTISGTNIDGQSFTKTGTIDNVQSAHHYILNFEYNPTETSTPQMGAVFIKINIKDEEITDNKIETFNTRPTITSFRYNLDKQFNFIDNEDIPETLDLQICGFNGLKYINISSSTSASQLGWPSSVVNILNENEDTEKLHNSGVIWNIGDLNTETNVITATVSFPKALFEKLSSNMLSEHLITISVEDEAEPYEPTEVQLRIVRNPEAIVIEDPIVFDKVDQNDPSLISSNSVTLSFSLADDIEGTPGVEYSKVNEDNWTFVAVSMPANAPKRTPWKAAQKKYNVTVTGLEAGTEYKYRAACGDFHSDEVLKFTTYSKFIIPNGDMEQWASVNGVGGQDGIKLPSRTGKPDFWGNGNPGAKMAGTILTDESTDMYHSPSKSARLESQFASVFGIGKFAAGNLFAGEYVKTDGTDGVLSFGKPFAEFTDGKQVDVRPTAMRVYVNYRPKPGVNKKGANKNYIDEGELDNGQIYVALTTAAIEIKTKKAEKLFNTEDPEVLAYGEFTFEENYGADGQLQELIIPIEYFDRSEGVFPTHLVIVCSASKYGDYFSGGEGSTMYVDDFELIYE